MSSRNSPVKKLQKEFPLGAIVGFDALHVRLVVDGKMKHGCTRTAYGTYKPHSSVPDTRVGQVVGCRKKLLGFVDGGHWDEPRHFVPDPGKSKYVLLVRTGYSNKELEVPPEHAWRLSPENEEAFVLPSIDSPTAGMSASAAMKGFHAEHPEWFPRDEKGRFRSATTEEMKSWLTTAKESK